MKRILANLWCYPKEMDYSPCQVDGAFSKLPPPPDTALYERNEGGNCTTWAFSEASPYHSPSLHTAT